MSYSKALVGRYMVGRGMKKNESPKQEKKPIKKSEFPFIYALLVMVLFLFLTGGKQEYWVPSIFIPLMIWIVVRWKSR